MKKSSSFSTFYYFCCFSRCADLHRLEFPRQGGDTVSAARPMLVRDPEHYRPTADGVRGGDRDRRLRGSLVEHVGRSRLRRASTTAQRSSRRAQHPAEAGPVQGREDDAQDRVPLRPRAVGSEAVCAPSAQRRK